MTDFAKLAHQTCKDAWLRIHGCGENRMYSLKRKASDDREEVECPKQQKPKWNNKFETVRSFLNDYFAPENGRCEKLPNPRYGRDEYRLPVWLSKLKIYSAYVEDCKNIQSEY